MTRGISRASLPWAWSTIKRGNRSSLAILIEAYALTNHDYTHGWDNRATRDDAEAWVGCTTPRIQLFPCLVNAIFYYHSIHREHHTIDWSLDLCTFWSSFEVKFCINLLSLFLDIMRTHTHTHIYCFTYFYLCVVYDVLCFMEVMPFYF